MGSDQHGLPAVEEQLTISTVGDYLESVRMTPGRDAKTKFPRPGPVLVSRYHRAISNVGGLPGSPAREEEEEARDRIREMSSILARAVPPGMRERIAGAAGGLAVIEVVLDKAAEAYPWELLGGPDVLGDAGDVIVSRKVTSLPPFGRKRQAGTILLTGSEAMQGGATFTHHELDMIASAVASSDSTVTVHPEPYLVPSALRELLARYRPAVFHLAAHSTRDELLVQGAEGPTLERLGIAPEVLGSELAGSQVRVAVLNCCHSATPPTAGGRPSAYRIADRADAAVVGMAGLIQSHAAAAFGQAFHVSLATGGSAAEAYFQGVRAIRAHPSCGLMWSMPVMYSRDSNVIPFPVDDQARARLGYFEAEHHMLALDQELAELKQMSDCPPSEWGLRAADPAVRVQRIDEQIPAILGAQPPGRDLERERIKLEVACEALGDILRATTKTLSDLSDPDEDRRGYARNSLELRRRELMRILDRFQFAFRDVRS